MTESRADYLSRLLSAADAQNVVAVYPIAVLKASKHAAAAAAFVDEIATGGGQQVLADKGFLPPA